MSVKRFERVERLKRECGVDVFYPLTEVKPRLISVIAGDETTDFLTLRQTERFLRQLKKAKPPTQVIVPFEEA